MRISNYTMNASVKKEPPQRSKRPCFAQIKVEHRHCNRHPHSSQRAARIPQCPDKAFVTDTDGVRLAWDLQPLGADLYFDSFLAAAIFESDNNTGRQKFCTTGCMI